MKKLLFFIMLAFGLNSCTVKNKITSSEYVNKPVIIVAEGMDSPENSKLLLVCFNKYFNQERYSSDFLERNKLNTIDYKTNMAIEIFLGETDGKIVDLKVDRIQENKDNLKVYFSYTDQKQVYERYSPFIIIQTSKSKKPILYFENGEQVILPSRNLYIKN